MKFNIQFSVHYKIGTKFNSTQELLAELIDFYEKYEEGYITLVEHISESSAKEASQNFIAFQFFQNRTLLGDAIEARVKNNLKLFGITVKRVIVLNIDVSTLFNEAIKATQIIKQK